MSTEFRAAMVQRLAEVEAEAQSLRAALAAYDLVQLKTANDGSPETRFRGKEPIKAIRILLAENNGRMNRDRLMKALMDGGATLEKKRAQSNLRISIDLNARIGNLVLDGEDVCLPEG